MLLLALACTASPTETGASDPWTVVADQVGSGVFLSAWTDGDTLRIVGGDMAGGPGVIAALEGETLCVEEAATERALWWIHGAGDGVWYAVGEAGTIVRDEGGVRTREDVDTDATLFGVFADGEDVWAVGGTPGVSGEVWRRRDGTWSLLASDLSGAVFKVWQDWLVGETSSWRIEGDTLVEHPTDARLLTVRGRDEQDVWAVGGQQTSTVLQWDGAMWSERSSSGLGQPLNGVWTAADHPVWIAGNFGTAAYLDGEDWVMADLPITSEHFHAVWWHDDAAWFLGGNLLTPGGNYGTIARYGETPLGVVDVETCR